MSKVISKMIEEGIKNIEDAIVKQALENVTETFRKRGWDEESKILHSDICCDIMNAKRDYND